MRKYVYELMTDTAPGGWTDRLMQRVLLAVSEAYGVVAGITRDLYKQHILPVFRSPKPVVSVGNITVGGVGKTPLVIWLTKALSAKGMKPAVISRGYGSKHGLNDEALMFQQIFPQVPIGTGSNRKKSIQSILGKDSVDVFIADDAFSHWPLNRDLDIVAIDASNPFGNGHLIPRGILREKPEALVRADVFVLTKTDKAQHTRLLCDQLRRINSRAIIAHSKHTAQSVKDVFSHQEQPLSWLDGKKAIAISGIGDPSSFEFTLQSSGADLTRHFVYPDHHSYTAEDLQAVADYAKQENINLLVTTHKDAVKIAPFKSLFGKMTVVYLAIDLEITEGHDAIIKRILSLRAA